MFGVPFDQLVWLAVGLLAAGAVTGFLAGLFGVGGGAVLVPVLFELFTLLKVPPDVRMQLCVGTSLAIIVPTSLRSFQAHRKKGMGDLVILRAWALPIVLGVLTGALVAVYAPAALFKGVFIAVSGTLAARLITGKALYFGDQMPTGPLSVVFGYVTGLLSSLMGIGGGAIANLFMLTYRVPIHQSVATAAGVGVLISIPGAIGYVLAGWGKGALHPEVAALQMPLALGFVSVLAFVLVIPTTLLTAPLGVEMAHRASKRTLEIAFGGFLLCVCLRFLSNMLFGI